MDNETEKTENQQSQGGHPSDSKPWLFKPGVSGNPAGRPKGSKSLKGFVKDYLYGLSDEEKMAFLDSIPKETVWKMAEGNPDTKTELDAGNTIVDLIKHVTGNKQTGDSTVSGKDSD